MTATTTSDDRERVARTGEGAGHRPPPRTTPRHRTWSWRIGALIALIVAVAALARFATASSGEGDVAPPPAAATPAEQISALERAVEADPEDGRAWQRLADAELRRSAETGDPSYHDLADRALERAATLLPADQDVLVTSGALALARHRFGDALRIGTQATDADPADPDALVVLVDASVELGRYDEAEQALDELLAIRPDLAALSRASYLQQLRGDTAAASLSMQSARAAAGSPFDSATTSTFLGDLRLGRGDLDGAMTSYEAALEQLPGFALAELGRASVLDARGERAEAIAALEELTTRFPLPAALALLGDLQAASAAPEDAALSYEVARAAFGSVTDAGGVADLERALFEADHGDPALALQQATSAYEDRATIFTADALGWALTSSGRAAEALPYVEEALSLGTEDASLHHHAAVAYAEAGQPERAATELAAAYELTPWLAPVHEASAAALAEQLGVEVPR